MIASKQGDLSTRQSKTGNDLVNNQDLKIVIEKALGLNYKIVNYHVKSFSDEKLGFLGSHRHLIVTIQKDDCPEKETHTFFLKSVPYEIEEQATLIEDSNVFYKEVNFLRHIMPLLMRELKDKSWIAQCYLVKDDVLVFENLTTKKFELRGKHLDVDSLKVALPLIAKLHASCILAEKRLGKSFLELHPDILQESMFNRDSDFYIWIKTSIDANVAIAKYLGLKHEYISKLTDCIFKLVGPSKTRRNVINHGDTKSFNFMFDNSHPPKCILLDYQLVRYTLPMADVAQFMYNNTRRSLRESIIEEMLKLYHTVLCETLKDGDSNISTPTYSDIRQEYEDMKIIGVVTTSLYTPIHFLGEKRCAELTKDSESFVKLVYQDRTNLLLNEMKCNPEYKEILTEIVEEMVGISNKLFA